MFRAWKKLDQQSIVIKQMWVFVAILLVVNAALLFRLATASDRLRIYLPPDISQGAMVTPNTIPKSTVYAFAFQIFTAINSWSTSGTQDYGKAITAYHNYLSPAFYQQLRHDRLQRETNGELSRQRLMSGVSGSGFQLSDVKNLGNGSWQVKLPVQIAETVDGSVIKHVEMQYSLIISRIHAPITINPWGLVITGFYAEPYRLKTLI